MAAMRRAIIAAYVLLNVVRLGVVIGVALGAL